LGRDRASVRVPEVSSVQEPELFGRQSWQQIQFALVADGYLIELHAIGIEYPETATMEPDHKGSVQFREVDFGGEGTLDNYRCRLTNDRTLVCLLGLFSGVQFKKVAVERRQLP
jgi:hypothetical protein